MPHILLLKHSTKVTISIKRRQLNDAILVLELCTHYKYSNNFSTLLKIYTKVNKKRLLGHLSNNAIQC